LSKLAVVTGAAGAIGSATAAQFARAGWRVIGVDVRRSADAPGIEWVEADLGEASEVEKVAAAVERTGGASCLVQCAAVQVTKPLLDTTDEEWDRVLQVNVRAPFQLARRVATHMSSGSIINVSSVHARATSPGMAAYVASKGALSALTRAMALELAPRGIRVNAVLPGAVESEMLRAGVERSGDAQAARDRLVASTPLRRIGAPDDIASLILFLADDERSAFITGQEFVADGGVLARLASE
jgi:NAD(P)-dependent dehydrogenase (short-subunit alcohol dehydrogenase family)